MESHQTPTPHWLHGPLVALTYGTVAALSLELFGGQYPHAPLVWPPTGVALAATLILGPRMLPWIFLAALATTRIQGLAALPTVGLAAVACIPPALGQVLLTRRKGFDPRLLRHSDVTGLLLLGVVLPPTVSAGIWSGYLAAAGAIPWTEIGIDGLVRWLGEASGILIVAPLLITSAGSHARPRRLNRTVLFFTFLATTVAISVGVANAGIPGINYIGSFLPFPILMFVALRYGPRTTAASCLVVTIGTMIAAASLGPDLGTQGATPGVIVLCAFLGVLSMTSLVLSASIAERNAATLELEHSQERLSLALEGAQDGAWDWNIQSGEVFYSDHWAKVLGCEIAEVPRQFNAWEALVHEEDRGAALKTLEEHLQGRRELYEAEFRVRTHRNTWTWILSRGKVVEWDEEGAPSRMTGTHKDIQEAKKSEFREQALVRMSSELSGPSDLESIARCIRDTGRELFNGAEVRLYINRIGSSFAEPVELECDRDHPSTPIPVEEARRESFGDRQGLLVEPVRWKNRMIGVLAASVAEGHRLDELDARVLGSCADRTSGALAWVLEEDERRRFEARMQHAQKLESLGVLAGGIAHDFNNLLQAILGNSGLALSQVGETSPQRRYLENVETAAERAAGLCNQLLAYSGRGHFVSQPLMLNDLLEEMGELLDVTIPKKASLRLDLDDELPRVEGDPSQMRQVILNLITNASEALGSGTGTIRLSTGVVELDGSHLPGSPPGLTTTPGTFAYLDVEDTGCGMDEEILVRLFDPFFTTKFTGRGLGLAAVLGILRGHNGTIQVHSREGDGTRIRILLPRSCSGCPEQSDTSAGLQLFGGESPENSELFQGHGKTILLMDDEPAILQFTSALLIRKGYRVLLASDGLEALDVLEDHGGHVDFALLDLMVPHLGGKELHARMQESHPSTRVILTSGYDHTRALEETSLSQDDFLKKPYRVRDLLEKLHSPSSPQETGMTRSAARNQSSSRTLESVPK